MLLHYNKKDKAEIIRILDIYYFKPTYVQKYHVLTVKFQCLLPEVSNAELSVIARQAVPNFLQLAVSFQ